MFQKFHKCLAIYLKYIAVRLWKYMTERVHEMGPRQSVAFLGLYVCVTLQAILLGSLCENHILFVLLLWHSDLSAASDLHSSSIILCQAALYWCVARFTFERRKISTSVSRKCFPFMHTVMPACACIVTPSTTVS